MNKSFHLLLFFIISHFTYSQKDTLNIYGPGGPFPPINEIARNYSEKNNIVINVAKGTLSKWKEDAINKADIIYSGSESMMTDFIKEIPSIRKETICPLYLRKSGLLVRPNNPKNIKSFLDILTPGINVMVVSGAGLTGVWEDMIGKTKSIDSLKLLRSNIVYFAEDSGRAAAEWVRNHSIDVWITWNVWQVSNQKLAEFIPVEEKYTLYRDCGIALTDRGISNSKAKDFYDYLKSEEVKSVFKKWGWITE